MRPINIHLSRIRQLLLAHHYQILMEHSKFKNLPNIISFAPVQETSEFSGFFTRDFQIPILIPEISGFSEFFDLAQNKKSRKNPILKPTLILYNPSCNYFQGGLIGTNGALARRDAVEGARVDFDLAAQTPQADSAVF